MLSNPDHHIPYQDIQDFVRNVVSLVPLSPAHASMERCHGLVLKQLQSFSHDTRFQLIDRKGFAMGLIHGPPRLYMSIAYSAHEFAKAIDIIPPFPFMELPPELRNRVYELCIPHNQTYTLPGNCHHQTKHNKPIHPKITLVSRAVRFETLAMFYAFNDFEFHANRYDFGPLVAQCDWLSTWAVKEIRQLRIRIAEMAWNGDVFEMQCANGLWELFRWYAGSDFGVGKLSCGTKGAFGPISEVVGLGARFRREGIRDEIDESGIYHDKTSERSVEENGADEVPNSQTEPENREYAEDEYEESSNDASNEDADDEDDEDDSDLRMMFDYWLDKRNLRCVCKASAWLEHGKWYSCSQYTPKAYMVGQRCKAECE
ncbi:hypothetical protein LTR27_012631 [Elasticomyces elasticus]|nr:hypothetical protein LTR27_012631 [Elasticomyces elasticus]